MILALLAALGERAGVLSTLGSLAVRSALAALLAFLVALLAGPVIVRWLKSRQFLEVETNTDSERLNTLNATKQPTPTMGGLMIIGAILLAGLICGDLSNRYVQLGLLSTLGFGFIGFIDDWTKLTRRHRRGLTAAAKSLLQFGIAFSLAVVVTRFFQEQPEAERLLSLHVPLLDVSLDLGWARGLPHVLLALLVITGTSNAVNLTDGMDGLAAGSMVIASLAMAGICVVVGRAASLDLADQLLYVRFSQEMTVFCTAMAGATLGFLWFNAPPAMVYMGDTGSLPLGSLLGFVAIVVKQEFALLLVGGIFVAEALSVIAQVGFFKATGGRRLLRCAPLHHHFQFKEMPTTRIVTRFWIVAVLLAGLGMASLALG